MRFLLPLLLLAGCQSVDVVGPSAGVPVVEATPVPEVTPEVAPTPEATPVLKLAWPKSQGKCCDGLVVRILDDSGAMVETIFYSDVSGNFPQSDYWVNQHLYFNPDSLEPFTQTIQ